MTYAEWQLKRLYLDARMKRAGHFYNALVGSILLADLANLGRLRKGFPELVTVHEEWMKGSFVFERSVYEGTIK